MSFGHFLSWQRATCPGVPGAGGPLSTSSTWWCGSLIASTRGDVEPGVVKRLGQEAGTAVASDQVARASEE